MVSARLAAGGDRDADGRQLLFLEGDRHHDLLSFSTEIQPPPTPGTPMTII
jgi:hypothetical protein